MHVATENRHACTSSPLCMRSRCACPSVKVFFVSSVVGDHIRIRKLFGLYYHHMLVMEVIDDSTIRVIHYNGNAEANVADAARFFSSASGMGSGPIAKVQQEVKTFTASELSMLEVLRYPSSFEVFDDPIERALSREAETDYRLFGNNCESFANWSCIGHNVTPQGARAHNSLVGVGMGGLTGGLLGGVVGRALSEHLEKDEENEIDEGTKRKIEVGAALGGAFIGALLGYATGKAYTDSQFANE